MLSLPLRIASSNFGIDVIQSYLELLAHIDHIHVLALHNLPISPLIDRELFILLNILFLNDIILLCLGNLIFVEPLLGLGGYWLWLRCPI